MSEAEMQAGILDAVARHAEAAGDRSVDFRKPATLIRRLAAENAALKAELMNANIERMASEAALEMAIERISTLEAENAAQAERIKRLEEAVTPSGDTKAAYMGEFSFPLTMRDDDGDEFDAKIPVPWTTIKEIMAAIRARAAMEPRDEWGQDSFADDPC